MGCPDCEANVEEAILDVPGVTEVEVDRASDTAVVEGRAEAGALVQAIEAAGYEAELG